MNQKRFFLLLFILALGFAACNNHQEQPTTNETPSQEPQVTLPAYNADSAYELIKAQLAFGPRVPGTDAQKKCAAFLHQQLKKYCDTVYKQETTVKAGDGKILPCINLIGAIHPNAAKRILLIAHWDSRPWADMDTKDKDKPILAADDCAGGVAMLIQLAQTLQSQPISNDLGVDIFLTDVEDYGKSEWGDDSYALGTQYWAAHPHVAGYKAVYGILVDMVSARGARFPLESFSKQFAPSIQQKVWDAANKAGYSSLFVYDDGGFITDDHVSVNKIAGIPTIDIINLQQTTQTSFAAHWHTHQDDLSIIDKATINAVGNTLLRVIYAE
jgi:hypothetical protein